MNLSTGDALLNASYPLNKAVTGRSSITRPSVREQRKLEIHEEIFDQCYRKFFFVEKYPELSERFILSFRRCFLGAAEA